MQRGESNEFGAGIWLFGQFVDRYATDAYGPPVSTIEAIERAGAVGDLEVLDINYPFSDPDITVEDVQRALDAAGLRVVHHAAHLHARVPARRVHEPRPGGPPPRARSSARRRSTSPASSAPPTVKLWPGQDGFDYPFQADYRELWRLALEGVRAVADDGPGHPRRDRVQDEGAAHAHQPSRPPRARSSASSQLGRDDVGIVVDLGHSLFAKEAPADVALARARPRSAVHDRGQRQLARVGRRHRRSARST